MRGFPDRKRRDISGGLTMATEDRLSLIVSAALAEGLSYGKYMLKYNYDPPCLKNPPPRASPEKPPDVRRRTFPPKECRHCGAVFTPHHNSQIYCTPKCQRNHKLTLYKLRCASENNTVERFCVVCGKALPPNTKSQVITCSPECRMIRKQIRKRDAQRRRKERTKC